MQMEPISKFTNEKKDKAYFILYIQKRTGDPGLFSFEYNLLPKMLTNVYHYMDQAKISIQLFQEKMIWKKKLHFLC